MSTIIVGTATFIEKGAVRLLRTAKSLSKREARAFNAQSEAGYVNAGHKNHYMVIQRLTCKRELPITQETVDALRYNSLTPARSTLRQHNLAIKRWEKLPITAKLRIHYSELAADMDCVLLDASLL